ncbi:UBP-type zinc finger domain-containing protein [Streptomyces sp. NPDC101165]|uniref:UBP-type zinc finger domain-containing protein n=1 Tax=Streptomyces sp. NPDC101165 TaxID=3366119 RepID=UPI003811651D
MPHDQTPGLEPTATPIGAGCVQCMAGDGPGWWFYLRRCAACEHIGCCDASPSQHGTKHAREAGHSFLTSFEPGESWFWNSETDQYYEGPELAPPTVYPASQPTQGPRDKVPRDGERQLH